MGSGRRMAIPHSEGPLLMPQSDAASAAGCIPHLQPVPVAHSKSLFRKGWTLAGPLMNKHQECNASETTLLSREDPVHFCQDHCVVQVIDRQSMDI